MVEPHLSFETFLFSVFSYPSTSSTKRPPGVKFHTPYVTPGRRLSVAHFLWLFSVIIATVIRPTQFVQTKRNPSQSRLVVSTPLKNMRYISQIGNLPQVGVRIRNFWNHHLVMYFITCEVVLIKSNMFFLWRDSKRSPKKSWRKLIIAF